MHVARVPAVACRAEGPIHDNRNVGIGRCTDACSGKAFPSNADYLKPAAVQQYVFSDSARVFAENAFPEAVAQNHKGMGSLFLVVAGVEEASDGRCYSERIKI